jgi:type II secretory pathway pseudopilin PulG
MKLNHIFQCKRPHSGSTAVELIPRALAAEHFPPSPRFEGGEGRGEEGQSIKPTVPSPQPSPRSCLTGRGRGGRLLPVSRPLNPTALVAAVNRKRFRSITAFTMIEIAISLGVIGFALVAIIGILPAGMSVQKDNREETLINFDGAYLMSAIRNGAQGQDNLTNYIINITNYSTVCTNGMSNAPSKINWFTLTGFSINGTTQSYNILTNGATIVGLLSLPKYLPVPPGSPDYASGNYYSNYTTADFRAITGAAVDQGASQTSKDFAFSYRFYPEIIPSASYAYAADPSWVNFTAPGLATNATAVTSPIALNLQADLNQIRLRFRWPVLPNGQVANGRQVFRGSASGTTSPVGLTIGGVTIPLYYIQPGLL